MFLGPMVWYQKFEHSLSHWLQKATEHVLGCVLCSPGCFSLFRCFKLEDVMVRYSHLPENARQHVQFDQGILKSFQSVSMSVITESNGIT